MNALRAHLLEGQVIPAHPLALTERRRLDERYQRALTRYYIAAGAGGLAVGVHTTQFEIRAPQHNLYRPVLELASETIDAALRKMPRAFVKIAGLCGRTEQATAEAEIALTLGYQAGLLSLGAWNDADNDEILTHCRIIADAMPIIGFYLQPAAGGRLLDYDFWRRFLEIENVVAIKIAPFNRYQTLDVVRAVTEAGRDDIALYTGNDDNIIIDLLTTYEFPVNGLNVRRRIVGGLLGQWAVGTHRASQMLAQIKSVRREERFSSHWLTYAASLTDANAALFDPQHHFAGCIPGIHEALRRQDLLRGVWCLNSRETLSPGQMAEIDRTLRAYPHLTDEAFVEENRDEWLS